MKELSTNGLADLAPAFSPAKTALIALPAAFVCGAIAAHAPAMAILLPIGLILFIYGVRYPIRFFAGYLFYCSVELFLTNKLLGNSAMMARLSSEALLLGVSAAVLLNIFIQRGRLHRTPADIPFFAFVFVCLFSAFMNGIGVTPVALGMRIYLRYAIPFYALIQLQPSRDELRPILYAILWAFGIQVGVGLLEALAPAILKPVFLARSESAMLGLTIAKGQTFTRTDLHTAIFGTLENYNNYGAFLALTIPVIFLIWKFKVVRSGRILLPALLVFAVIALVLTGSRSSMIAFSMGSMIIFWKMKRRWAVAVLLIGVLMLGAMALSTINANRGLALQEHEIYSDSLMDRWFLVLQPGQLDSSPYRNFRLYLWQHIGKYILLRSPFFGLGIGTFGSLYSTQMFSGLYEDLNIHARHVQHFIGDSNWITIYAQTGLLGLLSYFGIFIRFGRRKKPGSDQRAHPMHKMFQLLMPVFLTTFLIVAIFGPYFEARTTSLLLWIVAAMNIAVFHGKLVDEMEPSS
ncbi:MAG: O-antigen ligase family protein [Candidatus Eisenbacteria bacterium]|nr:O-antigen ligase family protein [Candidatus Eisenbacteria bacterium]